jgi:AraC-like DNA-binding protein
MPRNVLPLGAYQIMRAATLDEFERQVTTLFKGLEILDLPEGAADLDVTGNFCKLSKLQIFCCAHGAPITVKSTNADYFRLIYSVNGAAMFRIEGRDIATSSNQSCIISAEGARAVGEFSRDLQQTWLRIDANSLIKKLAAMIGQPLTRKLEFEPVVDLTTPASRHLRRMTDLLISSVESREAKIPPHAMAEFEEAVMAAFLCANRNNYSQYLERPAAEAAPWQVRRVEDYIEANWNQPISMEDIVAVTGASARSIFRAFQQSRKYSPMTFAKQLRLRHAHRMLNSPGAKTTITEIASACGYGDVGHFNKDFRRAFGETPSQVLFRAKGTATVIR